RLVRQRNRAECIDRKCPARIRVRTMLVAVASALGAGNVKLGGDEIPWAVLRRQQSAADVDLTGDNRGRSRPVWRHRLATIDLGHEPSPGRCSKHATLRVVLDFLGTVEPVPDAGNEVS